MSFDRFLPVKFKEYFLHHPINESLQCVHLLVLRRDGIILYANSNDIDKSAAGALMGGVWQAVNALIDLIPYSRQQDVYRLSFDTSSSGIYMIPLKICQQEYYLSMIYYDQLNPAIIKNKIRELGQNLSDYLTQGLSQKAQVKKGQGSSPKENYLFSDISDAEIDNLFSFASS